LESGQGKEAQIIVSFEKKANTTYPFTSFERNQTSGHSVSVYWQAIITNITSSHLQQVIKIHLKEVEEQGNTVCGKKKG